MHHAAKGGHFNCVSFLVNFGVNIWRMDNEFKTALDTAALENRQDIVNILDMAQGEQVRKNPKVVQSLKEKALKDAEKNIQLFERLQTKASKDMQKMLKQQERQMNGDFKAPTDEGLFKRLTHRIKKGNTSKAIANGNMSTFSHLSGTKSKASAKQMTRGFSGEGFMVSETDQQGNRTLRSVKGTVSKMGGQVMYVPNIDIGESVSSDATDGSARPLLTDAFPGLRVKNDPDSGIDSFESQNGEETPGIFNRPMMGNKFALSFLNQFEHLKPSLQDEDDDLDTTIAYQNGDTSLPGTSNGVGGDATNGPTNRTSGGSDLPWNADDVEQLDDDDDDDEYTPVMMFLEGCGLTHYAHLFLDQDVDMDALMRLSNQDFEDMKLPIGPRRKLMDAIQRRRNVLSEPAQMYDSQL